MEPPMPPNLTTKPTIGFMVANDKIEGYPHMFNAFMTYLSLNFFGISTLHR